MNDKGPAGMTLIVKTVTRLTLGFILVYGIYIGMAGNYSPGGGFAGGVIIALAFVHIMLAFGSDVALHRIHAGTLRVLAGAGGLGFLYVVFFNSKFALSKMALHVCEMVIVGAALFAIFVALVLLSKGNRDSE